jgi:arsenite methyltransferase
MTTRGDGSARAPSGSQGIRDRVRERYAALASSGGCCDSGPGTRAPPATGTTAASACCSGSTEYGYAHLEPRRVPAGADLGLGCGNPTALLTLKPGEVVLDLGSGAGVDCFLAAPQVGPTGHVIGVDMTPEMVARARENARRGGYSNIEFRQGEIERLPVPDASVDVVLSNCVINLVPDKGLAYRESFRVLRPGGRVAMSDIVALRAVPPELRQDADRWASCESGAIPRAEVRRLMAEAGFVDIEIDAPGVLDRADTDSALPMVAAPSGPLFHSASIRARKPVDA